MCNTGCPYRTLQKSSFISSEYLVFARLGVEQKKSLLPPLNPTTLHHSDVQVASKSSGRCPYEGKTGSYRRHGGRGGSVTGGSGLKQYSQNPRIAHSQKDWKRHRIDSPTELQKGIQPFPYKNVLELNPFVSFLFPQLFHSKV